jgi:hypothetical protein
MAARKVILLSFVPITIVGLYIFLFGLNIPFLDQWEVVSLLQKKQQGLLTLSDLFAQHNEHRPFFPRLIWIAFSTFTHYNINVQLWVNLCLTIGTFAFFVNRAARTWEMFGVRSSSYLIPLLSLLVFNLGQRESWLQGIQTIMFLGMACVIMGLFLLSDDSSGVKFAGAILLGVIATYSMANGLLYWLIGIPVIWVSPSKNSRIVRSILWIISSVLCFGFFLTNWSSSGQLNFAYGFTHPFQWLVWILDFLGSPLMTLWYVAWIFGCISVALYILIIRQLFRTKQWQPLIPYFAITLFILLTAFSISLGRMEMGLRQAVVPRYLTMSVWYWTSLLTLLPISGMKIQYQRALCVFFAVSLICLTIGGGWRGYVSLYQRILPAYQAVKSGQVVSDEVLAQISSDPVVARTRLEFLCENKLSVCTTQP